MGRPPPTCRALLGREALVRVEFLKKDRVFEVTKDEREEDIVIFFPSNRLSSFFEAGLSNALTICFFSSTILESKKASPAFFLETYHRWRRRACSAALATVWSGYVLRISRKSTSFNGAFTRSVPHPIACSTPEQRRGPLVPPPASLDHFSDSWISASELEAVDGLGHPPGLMEISKTAEGFLAGPSPPRNRWRDGEVLHSPPWDGSSTSSLLQEGQCVVLQLAGCVIGGEELYEVLRCFHRLPCEESRRTIDHGVVLKIPMSGPEEEPRLASRHLEDHLVT
ncbi:hypothetical protein GWK47_017256 [Chionoecetes opilio]|uniref:Uncharacterized protein n=1 Tax=Chionoecetes opilio TaxID=41210 RepID=A0A8J4XSR7_CHIOP|nr:hypothetical protein GWK47_017256 [Chionoecetes opilio]